MILDLNVVKGTFTRGPDKEGNFINRCNFYTSDDDVISLYLTDDEVKPYLNLKQYEPCKIKIKLYKSAKNAKYNITKGL